MTNKETQKATLSAIIRQPTGVFTVLQIFNEEVSIIKAKWQDRRTGKERSIITPTGIRRIKQRYHSISTYGRALMITDAISTKNFKLLKELTSCVM